LANVSADPLSELLRGKSVRAGEVRERSRGAKAIDPVDQPVGTDHAPEALTPRRLDGDHRRAVIGNYTASEIRALLEKQFQTRQGNNARRNAITAEPLCGLDRE
jgi:hypothetical protein